MSEILNDFSLPLGKEFSVRLSIVRPLEIDSYDAIFLFGSGNVAYGVIANILLVFVVVYA